MRMKTQRILAALLSLVLLLALAPAGWAEGEEGGGTNEPVLEGSGIGESVSLPAAGVVLTNNNSVVINLVPADKVTAEDQTFANEMKKAKVEADLYLIAPAVADPTYDTYSYNFTGSAFAGLKTSIENALKTDPAVPTTREIMLKSFSPIAQAAAGIAKGPSVDPTKVKAAAENETEITVGSLPAGMYLLILRGADLAKNETETGYFTTAKKSGTGEYADPTNPGQDVTITVTRALSDNYEFLFEPQIITLPTKMVETAQGTVQSYNTAFGVWSETLNITAKPDWKPRNGDLRIRKEVNETVDGKQYAGTKATFGYRVVATLNGKTVYDNICEITIPDQDEVTIEDKIPVGAVVTVSELYDGSRYKYKDSRIVISGDATNATLVINSSQDSPATIEFTNDNDGTPKEGYGILNTFTYNGSAWVWNNNIPIETE